METSPDKQLVATRLNSLEASLRPHIAAEQYFERTGRTFRKSRLRLWINRHIKPPLLRALFTLVGIYARGKRNAIRPVLKRLTFTFPDLPEAFDGFELLQISDLHIDRMDGLAEALVPLLQPLRPDLCALTGDYRWEIVGSCAEVYPRLDKLLKSIHAGDGVVGILGNHDASEIAFHLEDRGVRMLVNESILLRRGAATLCIAGTDDPFDYFCGDLNATFADVPPGVFTILLCHTPQLYEGAAERGVSLYLCGHTHAGQIRLPGIGAVKKNVSLPRKFIQGEWTHGNMQGYTSWGAGCSTLPIRLNCPAEVTLIRLRRASPEAQ